MENLIEVKNLTKTYNVPASFLGAARSNLALKNVNLEIKKGEILALVGESGCGKSTLGNCILKLIEPDCGEILFEGEDILKFDKKKIKDFRKHAQLIFQNPYSDVCSSDLVHKVCPKKEFKERVIEVLKTVGLDESDLKRYPHEFSGGQRQRIAIARALILRPVFIVADEPISALDVSIQAQILNLLKDLKDNLNLTYLFISHDLNVVRYLCDRVVILFKGEVVEEGDIEEVFNNPKHPYTKTLLRAIPVI
jgi:ABC-type oligopeptide transport system ATPase subunit